MSANGIESTVFLVDDDATVRAALRRGLVAEGFRCGSSRARTPFSPG
jgi:FixJ family two-component response regulator